MPPLPRGKGREPGKGRGKVSAGQGRARSGAGRAASAAGGGGKSGGPVPSPPRRQRKGEATPFRGGFKRRSWAWSRASPASSAPPRPRVPPAPAQPRPAAAVSLPGGRPGTAQPLPHRCSHRLSRCVCCPEEPPSGVGVHLKLPGSWRLPGVAAEARGLEGWTGPGCPRGQTPSRLFGKNPAPGQGSAG